MARPSPAIIGSIALHAGVGGLLFLMLAQQPAPKAMVMSVPVSIISDTITVEAAPGENPTDEVVPETETAPPPPPQPDPVPPPAQRPTPTPKTTPPRPPQRPVTQPREEPSLNTEDLVSGNRRRADRNNNRRNLPPSGDRGQGEAPRAIGQGDLRALAGQIAPNWDVPCELPGGDNLTIGVRVRLSVDGRVIGTPRLVQNRSDATWRAATDTMLRAIRATAPFDMPAGYEEQEITITFQTARFCGNR